MDLVPSESQFELKIKDSTLTLISNKKYADFKVRDKNNLTLFVEGIINDDKGIIKMDFIKLYPTLTELTVEEIEDITYEFKENNKTKSKLEFNKEMMDLETSLSKYTYYQLRLEK